MPINHPIQKLFGLYAITHHDEQSLDTLLNDVEALLKGGAQIIQFRDKHHGYSEKKQRAQALQKLCKHYLKLFIINDDLALASDIQSDGIHLGQNDANTSEARKVLGNNAIIGVSCHDSIDFALTAQKQGADYIALGRFFASKTKPQASLAPIECIAEISQQCSLPIVAIGGITLDNAPSLLEHPVAAIAMVNDLYPAQFKKTSSMITPKQKHSLIEEHAKKIAALFN